MTPRVGRRHRAVVRVGGGLPVDVSARSPCRSSVARQRTAASRPRPNECRSSFVSNWSVGAGRRCKIRDDDEHQPLLLSRRRGAASHRCTALFCRRTRTGRCGSHERTPPRRETRAGIGARAATSRPHQLVVSSRRRRFLPQSRNPATIPLGQKSRGHRTKDRDRYFQERDP